MDGFLDEFTTKFAIAIIVSPPFRLFSSSKTQRTTAEVFVDVYASFDELISNLFGRFNHRFCPSGSMKNCDEYLCCIAAISSGTMTLCAVAL